MACSQLEYLILRKHFAQVLRGNPMFLASDMESIASGPRLSPCFLDLVLMLGSFFTGLSDFGVIDIA